MLKLRNLFLFTLLAATAPAGEITFQSIPGDTAVLHVNNAGTSSGFTVDGTAGHGFVRAAAGNTTLFDAPGSLFTEAVNVDDHGVVYGNAFTSFTTSQIFQRNPDGSAVLLPPIGGASMMEGGNTNASGTMVGGADNHAFILPFGGSATVFDVPGADTTGALGLNDAGYVVGYSEIGAGLPQAFIRDPSGTIIPYFVPNSVGALLYAIDNHNDLAGAYFGFDGHIHGFVYRSASGDFTTVDYTRPNTIIFSMNDNWQLAGESFDDGNFSTGPFDGFLATESPEPATELPIGLALVACALGYRGMARWRTKRDTAGRTMD